MIKIYHLFTIVSLLIGLNALGQPKDRFQKEVNDIVQANAAKPRSDSTIVFTGSSSIRLWEGLQESFPKEKIVNTGFGGSEMSDLLHYKNELILSFNPYKVFIYEGDNDIFNGKKAKKVLRHHKKLVRTLKRKLPSSQLYLIAAKPSPARWKFKPEYEKFNLLLQQYTLKTEGVEYIDVWSPMLDNGGNPRKDIFIEDKLHMNEEGYEVWNNLFRLFVK